MLFLFSLFCIFPHKYEITCDDRSVVIESEPVDLQDYVPLKQIAEILNINYILNNNTQRLYVTGNDHKLIFISNINTIMLDSIYQNIPLGPIYRSGEIYFPVGAIINTIGRSFEKLVFIKEVKEAPVIDKISFYTRGDSTVLKFDWPKPLDFDVQFSLKKVVVEIDGRYKNKVKLKGIKSIKSAKLTPYNTYTRLEFDIENANSFLEREDEVVFYSKKTKNVNLIVLDPGHGGIDPGAVSKKGLYEKDVNLDVAQMLRNFVKDSLGMKVILTREDDSHLPLAERTSIANRNGADLFISIHCNSSMKSPMSQGFETFFLSEAKTDEARAAAALENAALKFDGIEPTNEISFILYDLAQNAFLQESNTFAEHIQSAAEKVLSIPSRGVSQAGFYVLRGAFVPAVLIETAFISNGNEEKLLRKHSFKKSLAYCIFQGIKSFVKDYERRLNN